MNTLFLTVNSLATIDNQGIYPDLMRKFRDEGHQLYIVYPTERKYQQKTAFIERDGVHFLRVKTGNIRKTNIVEKYYLNNNLSRH